MQKNVSTNDSRTVLMLGGCQLGYNCPRSEQQPYIELQGIHRHGPSAAA